MSPSSHHKRWWDSRIPDESAVRRWVRRLPIPIAYKDSDAPAIQEIFARRRFVSIADIENCIRVFRDPSLCEAPCPERYVIDKIGDFGEQRALYERKRLAVVFPELRKQEDRKRRPGRLIQREREPPVSHREE
jgi:hypothetical protein